LTIWPEIVVRFFPTVVIGPPSSIFASAAAVTWSPLMSTEVAPLRVAPVCASTVVFIPLSFASPVALAVKAPVAVNFVSPWLVPFSAPSVLIDRSPVLFTVYLPSAVWAVSFDDLIFTSSASTEKFLQTTATLSAFCVTVLVSCSPATFSSRLSTACVTVVVLFSPFTVITSVVPFITTVWVIFPLAFTTFRVIPAVLLSSMEQTSLVSEAAAAMIAPAKDAALAPRIVLYPRPLLPT
jgi:hypothetical protein